MILKNKPTVSNLIILILLLVFCSLNLFLYFCFYHITTWLFVCLVTVNIALICGNIVLFCLNKISLLRTCFIAAVLLFVFSWGYQIFVWLGYDEIFSSTEALKRVIVNTGAWGIVVFFLIQFLQVVILPIPGAITTIAGSLIFGPTTAMIVSVSAVLLGSFVAFFIGRFLGEKVVVWIVGKETCEKYAKLLYEKGKYLFFLMMLFPFFPDDILCMVAGMTTMSLRFFSVTMLITRPLGIIPTCYLGSGTIIPYSGWGLIVWGILIVIMVALIILSWKYQSKIEQFVMKLADKITKKPKKENANANNSNQTTESLNKEDITKSNETKNDAPD